MDSMEEIMVSMLLHLEETMKLAMEAVGEVLEEMQEMEMDLMDLVELHLEETVLAKETLEEVMEAM